MTTLAQVEATLSADWQKFVAFIQEEEQKLGSFLSQVATGGPVLISDIQAISGTVAGKLTTINATIGALKVSAAIIAPTDTGVQKVLSDLDTGANDVAELSQALSTGSTTGDDQVVTKAVAAVNAVQTLSGIASQASAALAQITSQSSTATQAVSPPTPPVA